MSQVRKNNTDDGSLFQSIVNKPMNLRKDIVDILEEGILLWVQQGIDGDLLHPESTKGLRKFLESVVDDIDEKDLVD